MNKTKTDQREQSIAVSFKIPFFNPDTNGFLTSLRANTRQSDVHMYAFEHF